MEDGTYTGTFQRIPDERMANITITIAKDSFSGTSDMYRFPLIAKGSVKWNDKSTATFNASGYFTADFDWTLILNGDYTMQTYEDLINISRENKDSSRDIYRLKKQ